MHDKAVILMFMSAYSWEWLYDMGVWKKYWSGGNFFVLNVLWPVASSGVALVENSYWVDIPGQTDPSPVPAAVMQHMNCNC